MRALADARASDTEIINDCNRINAGITKLVRGPKEKGRATREVSLMSLRGGQN